MPTNPANLERLTQALSILRAVIDASDSGEGGYDLAPALRVVVKLVYEADDRLADTHSTKLLEAGCVLTACIVTHTTAHGLDWDLTWPLLPVVRLLEETIADMRPRADRRLRRRQRSAGEVVRLVGGPATDGDAYFSDSKPR